MTLQDSNKAAEKSESVVDDDEVSTESMSDEETAMIFQEAIPALQSIERKGRLQVFKEITISS